MRHVTTIFIVLVVAAGGVAYGVLAGNRGWFPAALLTGDAPRDPSDAPAAKPKPRDLRGLAYLQGYEKATDGAKTGAVTRGEPFVGLNLVVSAHAPEIFLMDMDGRAVHKWWKPYDAIDNWHWGEKFDPEWPPKGHWATGYFRRAYVDENGDILAMYGDCGLIKMDAKSNVIWAYKERCHHEITYDDKGRLAVMTRDFKERDIRMPYLASPSIEKGKPLYEEFIDFLDPKTGKLLERVSLLECVENSIYATMLHHIRRPKDIFHANSIEWVDGRHVAEFPMFERGLFLISLRDIDTIALFDLENRTVRWAQTGPWHVQHEPTILADGRMMVFDNRGRVTDRGLRSRVIEMDVRTQKILWAYEGTPEHDFHSGVCGAAYRLPNDNTLIVSSTEGKVVEVNRDGQIVWEWNSPYRTGEKKDVIPTLHDVRRIDPESLDFAFNQKAE